MDVQTNKKPKGIRTWFLNHLGITTQVTIKVYHGYGYGHQLLLYGHVFKTGPKPRKKYRKSFLRNTWALLRLFMVKPYPHLKVKMQWKDQIYDSKTDADGFFKFQWEDHSALPPGWNEVEVMAFKDTHIIAQAQGAVYIPYATQFGFISDIDDTFLISHSSNLRKRLFVLFTENARTRLPFEGVVKHYKLLARSHTTEKMPNPFFFVSSSEWNLYDYILEFAQVNQIPKGVFLLSQLKRFNQLLKTGQNHKTKLLRIARILENYPAQRFVLLGDSSQQDPYIYETLVSHFPKQIFAVYIRDIYKKNRNKAADILGKIESKGVPCCFFKNSDEAILHSIKIGLIPETELAKIDE